jgi:hypothetical protein
VAQGFPASDEQGETAFAEAPKTSQQPVVGALVDVQRDTVGTLWNRGQHATACTVVAAAG